MIRYNWEQKDWPNFKYKLNGLAKSLQTIIFNNGKYDGGTATLALQVSDEAILDLMVVEAIKTSEIEGEYYSKKDVLSSIKKNLGLHQKAFVIQNKNAENISSLMVAMRKDFAKPLTKAMLLQWHNLLFTYNTTDIQVGKWRTHKEPMQVISGVLGKTKVHFEAPPSASMMQEMKQYVEWFNNTAPNGNTPINDAVERAALAHLYFLSVHPFEDGNGRIARTLTEKVLAQHNEKPWLISISFAIEKKKKEYYAALQVAQRKNEITPWINYFVHTVLEAQDYTTRHINFVLQKKIFYETHQQKLNTRQLRAIKRIFAEGVDGFEGGMNAQKYIGITKTSKATATRDLQELLAMGLFKVFGAGRNTSYELVLKKN